MKIPIAAYSRPVIFLLLLGPIGTAAGEDLYEPDNTPATATILPVNSSASQLHDLSSAGDEDWFKFYAVEDQFYEVLIFNAGANADTTLALFNTDGSTLAIPVVDDQLAGEDELLSWQATSSGVYYIRVANYDAEISGDGTDYSIVLYRPEADETGIIEGIVVSNQEQTDVAGAVITTDSGSSSIVEDDGSFVMETDSGEVSIQTLREGFAGTVEDVTLQKDEVKQVEIVLEGNAQEEELTGVITTTGAATNARFTAGASIPGMDQPGGFTSGDEMLIAGTVYPDESALGQHAYIFTVIKSITADGLAFNYIDVNDQQHPWDGRAKSLQPAREVLSMGESEALTIHSGTLQAGDYRVFIGYQLGTGGPLHFNSIGFKLTVTD